MTIRAAEYLRMEKVIGSLEVGKFADLVVLENNFLEVAEEQLGQNQVLMTMVGGKIVFSTGDVLAGKGFLKSNNLKKKLSTKY